MNLLDQFRPLTLFLLVLSTACSSVQTGSQLSSASASGSRRRFGVNCNRGPPLARTAFFFYTCFSTKSDRKLCPRRILAVRIEHTQESEGK